LPVYQREISALLGHIGLSSLKTPIGELTFTEHSRFQGAVVSAAKPTGEERSSALPRPSYPRPGLDSLRHAVSEGPNDYLIKDARYIAFFDGPDPSPGEDGVDKVMLATRTFLRPAKTLARCLRAYVDIIPDSQLLLVDVRRVLYFFFRMHANAVVALRNNRDHPEDPSKDLAELYNLVDDVRGAVLQAIGATGANSDRAGGEQPVFVETDDGRNPDFAEKCRSDNLKPSADAARDLQAFSYLQPYVTIALGKPIGGPRFLRRSDRRHHAMALSMALRPWRRHRPKRTRGKMQVRSIGSGKPITGVVPHPCGIRVECAALWASW